MIPLTPALRDLLARNLARHTRREHALDGRRHAAVAIVVVDSDAERDGDDPFPIEPDYFEGIPSDVSGLDGLIGADVESVTKTEVLDLTTLGLALDNLEGMTFGPRLADGRR